MFSFKKGKFAVFLFLTVFLFLEPPFSFFAQAGQDQCDKITVIGPLKVANPDQAAANQSKYILNGSQARSSYNSDETCHWQAIIGSEVVLDQKTQGSQCQQFKPELTIKEGKRWRALFTLKSADGSKICSFEQAITAGEPSFPFTKKLEVDYPRVGGETITSQTTLTQYIHFAFVFAVSIIGVLALFNLVMAGIAWTAAGGNANAIEGAKNRILATVFSVILLLSAYLILITINPELVQLREPRLTGFILAANCQKIRTCLDYGHNSSYDFSAGASEDNRLLLKQRACSLDSCNVVESGCFWDSNAASADLRCQPRQVLLGRNLVCQGPKDAGNSINSCEDYDKLVGNQELFAQGKIAAACEPNVCGITNDNSVCIMKYLNDFDPRGNFPQQCFTLGCNQVNNCEDYKTVMDRLGFDVASDFDDYRRTCWRDPCGIGTCIAKGSPGGLTGGIVSWFQCKTAK